MKHNSEENLFSDFISVQKERKETVGTFKNGKVCPEYTFQHVIQRTYNRKKLFFPSGAAYYENIIKTLCPEYDCILICQVVMPTHIHEIYYTRDIKKLSVMRNVACTNTSRFIRREFRELKYEVPVKVFERNPGYVPIRDRRQLLKTVKYVKDNDLYLRNTIVNGKPCKAPYSCFEHWEHGHFKPFYVEGLCKLYGISVRELLDLLNSSTEEVNRFAERFNEREFLKADERIFRNNPKR